MMITNGASRSARDVARHAPLAQRACMHLGRATAADTKEFVTRSESPSSSVELRLGADLRATIIRRGIGSPYLWAKDVPRIDATKAAITGFQGNFVQASINPYSEAPPKADDKQAYVESLALQEAIEDEGIPREALVLSALLEDSLQNPALIDPIFRLSSEFIEKGIKVAVSELDVEALDHAVLRVPEDIVMSDRYQGKLLDSLLRAAESLDTMCAANKIQSFGFALPSFASSTARLERFVESALVPLSERHANFSSLQLPVALTSTTQVFPPSLREFQRSRDILVFAEKVFDASLSNGKPLVLRTYMPNQGEDVALLLKSAFNLAISIERKYMEKVLPDHSQHPLPAAEDVAWAHILANQHSQFDNLEEWIYIRETQILPRFEMTVKQFHEYEDLKEFGFAYSMAVRELLKCFTASIEILDAGRADNILTVFNEKGVISGDESLEHVAAKAALSAGADVVLFQEQLGKAAAFSPEPLYTPTQLSELTRLASPFLVVES